MTIFALLHPFSRFNWLTWSIHPSTVIGLAVLGGLYLWRARDRDAEKKLPAWRQVSFFSSLLAMSALKFAIVVMFYMHLKYDHKLFRALFTGPLFVAAVTLISLLFLFGQLVARFGPDR